MSRKISVMDTKVVEAGVKTNIVDEGLDVFYDPIFYNKQQAFEILQQLKSEIGNDNLESSSDVLSFKSIEHVANRDEEPVSTVCKQTLDNEPQRYILTKIREDIKKALDIRLNLCYADWHKDGRDRKVVTK